MIFNAKKEGLLEMITEKIALIDKQCGVINHEIEQYSEERVENLNRNAQDLSKAISQLKRGKNGNQSILIQLKIDLGYLEEQQRKVQQEYKQKQAQMRHLQRTIIFMQQKYKEQVPHFPSFVAEQTKSKKNNVKVRYAKEKLHKLNQKLNKECDEVQYQFRLNKLMRQKLKDVRKKKEQESRVKQSNGTAISSIDDYSQSPSIQPPSFSKNTEFSEYNESIITSFRDC